MIPPEFPREHINAFFNTRDRAQADVLGVNLNTVSYYQLRKTYRALMQQYHPDVNKSSDATIRSQQINAAYKHLVELFEFYGLKSITPDDLRADFADHAQSAAASAPEKKPLFQVPEFTDPYQELAAILNRITNLNDLTDQLRQHEPTLETIIPNIPTIIKKLEDWQKFLNRRSASLTPADSAQQTVSARLFMGDNISGYSDLLDGIIQDLILKAFFEKLKTRELYFRHSGEVVTVFKELVGIREVATTTAGEVLTGIEYANRIEQWNTAFRSPFRPENYIKNPQQEKPPLADIDLDDFYARYKVDDQRADELGIKINWGAFFKDRTYLSHSGTEVTLPELPLIDGIHQSLVHAWQAELVNTLLLPGFRTGNTGFIPEYVSAASLLPNYSIETIDALFAMIGDCPVKVAVERSNEDSDEPRFDRRARRRISPAYDTVQTTFGEYLKIDTLEEMIGNWQDYRLGLTPEEKAGAGWFRRTFLGFPDQKEHHELINHLIEVLQAKTVGAATPLPEPLNEEGQLNSVWQVCLGYLLLYERLFVEVRNEHKKYVSDPSLSPRFSQHDLKTLGRPRQ